MKRLGEKMRRILIVDDEKEMCNVLSQFFQAEGFQVDLAYDAFDALAKTKLNKYKYVLVDLVLPGSMNGIDIIRRVKKHSPSTRIIAYSGFCDLDITDRVISAGANNFIPKPFKQKELARLMRL